MNRPDTNSTVPASAATEPAQRVPWGDWGRLESVLDGQPEAICVVPRPGEPAWRWRELDAAGLAEWVRLAHDRGVRLSLELDCELAEAELKTAARILQIAQQANIDELRVRDPALLVLGKTLPDLPLAWSGSLRVCNSADVRAAKRLGLSHVMPASRAAAAELTGVARSEGIGVSRGAAPAGCGAVPGFCLLSSWSRGRSADRGGCPCGATRDDTSRETKEPGAAVEAGPPLPGYTLEIEVDERGIHCRCEFQGNETAWILPKTVIRRAHKAVSIGQLLEFFEAHPLADCQLDEGLTNAPDFLMMPRKVNYLADQVRKFLQRCLKKERQVRDAEPDPSLRAVLDSYERCPSSRTVMGQPPDRARLDAIAVEPFLQEIQPSGVLVEGVAADQVRELDRICRRVPLIVALPPVFFEPRMDEIRRLLEACKRIRCRVEVNSWGGWHLARSAGVRMEAGPGLPVLNSLAARLLGSLGIENVTWNLQADRRKLEQLSQRCPVHASLVVFARPPLLVSRDSPRLEDALAASGSPRDTALWSRQEHNLWAVRPAEPFDLRGIANDRICVKHQVVDLVASPDPIGEWSRGRRRGAENFAFNYDRRLV